MQDDSRRRPQLTGAVPEHGSQSGYLGEAPGCAEAHGGETESSSSNSVVTSVFNLLNSHSKNTISIWDVAEGQKFILRYANLQFLKLVGKTRQDVFGKTLEEIVRSGGRQISRSFLACARNRREIDFIHKQRNRFLLTRLSPQVELERTVRLIGTSMDITEYIGEQRRLKTANRQIRQQSGLLNMQLRFESMIARTRREFMDAGCAGFEGCLYGINREMGLLLNADQALIFEKRSENLYVHKAYWARNDARFCTAGSHIRSIQEGQSVLPRINRLLVINDTGAGILPAFAGELRHMNIRALLAVPICRDAHTYGLFCLTHTRAPHIWSTAEISMAKTAADTIMSAYLRLHIEKGLSENIRVLTEYDESLQDLLAQKETIAEISRRFLRDGSQRFDECVYTALQDIGDLLSADGVRMLYHTPAGEMETYEWHIKGLPCRIGRENSHLNSMVLAAMKSKRTAIIIDDTTESHPLAELAGTAAGEGLRSLLAVPVFRAEGAAGVIVCFKSIGVKRWERADLISAETFADVFMDAYRLRKDEEIERALDNLS